MSDSDMELQSTWANRELPILRVALRRIDSGESLPDLESIRLEIGLDVTQMRAGLKALQSASPPYLVARVMLAGPDNVSGFVEDVTERTRRTLGTWPTPTSVLDALVLALREDAEHQTSEDSKSHLKGAADVLGGMFKQIAIGVISAKIEGR